MVRLVARMKGRGGEKENTGRKNGVKRSHLPFLFGQEFFIA
jgi:hypothetical protein